jgi:hypothetical protein
MLRKPALSRSMTDQEFENGHWYAGELRDFARELGDEGVHLPIRGRAAHVRFPPRRQTSQACWRLVVGFRGLVMGL